MTKLVRRLKRRFQSRRHELIVLLVCGGVVVATFAIFHLMVN